MAFVLLSLLSANCLVLPRRLRIRGWHESFEEVRVTNRRSGWVGRLVMGVVAGAVVLVAAKPAAAQSTIFNIPTTDTVAAKKGYFEFDYLAQAPTPDAGSFQIYMPRVVFGVGSQVEVGVNINATHYSDDGGNYAQFQPNIKYKFYANDDAGVAGAAGVIFYTPLNNRDASDSFGLVYGEVSKKVKTGSYGPRMTVGVYGSVSYGDDNTGGVLLGYEQPLSSKVSFVADWFSGKNFWGYFTPGISVTLPHSGLLNVGYSLGNDSYDGNKNRALFVYYGVTFP